MKQIPLSQGSNRKHKKLNLFAQVDDEDFERLNAFKWCAHKDKNTFYVLRTVRENGKQYSVLMHRVILGITDPKILVDHEDHNGLNCQKYNLRKCTNSQNCANVTPRGKSKYLGVSLKIEKFKKVNGEISVYVKWCASICLNRKHFHIGLFKTEEDAAKAYDKKAKELHKEFANLNFK